MLDSFLNLAQEFFALDFDVLSGRQWWNNELAMNTFKIFERIAHELDLTRQALICKASGEDPIRLKYLVNINKEIKTLTDYLIIIGKDSLFYNNVKSNGDEVKGLIKAYAEIENLIRELDNKLMIGLEGCRVSPEVLNSGVLDWLEALNDNLIKIGKNLLDSQILQEIRDSSPTPSFSSSSAPSSPNSKIIQELNKLPNGFRIP